MSDSFPVTADDLLYLSSKDKRLKEAIELLGPIERTARPGAFRGLIYAICGQQISGQAHKSIWSRFCSSFSPQDAALIAAASPEELRRCGLSLRKAQYISNIARAFAQGELEEEELRAMSDDDLRKRLIALPGVGHWTVDMLLIFTFQRRNILSRGDLGIQKGLRMLYGKKSLSQELFDRYHKRYSPLASVASFYLWEIASGRHSRWRDPAQNKKDQA